MSAISISLATKSASYKYSSDNIYLNTDQGDVNILPGHADMVSSLKSGIISFVSSSEDAESEQGNKMNFRIEEGIIQFSNNNLTIIARSIAMF